MITKSEAISKFNTLGVESRKLENVIEKINLKYKSEIDTFTK